MKKFFLIVFLSNAAASMLSKRSSPSSISDDGRNDREGRDDREERSNQVQFRDDIQMPRRLALPQFWHDRDNDPGFLLYMRLSGFNLEDIDGAALPPHDPAAFASIPTNHLDRINHQASLNGRVGVNQYESPDRNNIQVYQDEFDTPIIQNNRERQAIIPPRVIQNNGNDQDFETPPRNLGNIPLFGNLGMPQLRESPQVDRNNPNNRNRILPIRRLGSSPFGDLLERPGRNNQRVIPGNAQVRRLEAPARVPTPPYVSHGTNIILPHSPSSAPSSPGSH